MKTVVITGSSRGLGKALALHYLSAGWQVLGCSRQQADWSHPHYHHHCCDVTQEVEVVSWFRGMKKQGMLPEAVIHNAGAAAMNHTLLTSTASFKRLWEVNTLSAFLIGREAAKRWVREKTSGKLIFISTVAVPLALEGEAAYVSAKAGLEGLAMSWANELKPLNISVNVIGPGPVDTALWRSVPADAKARLLERLQEPRETTTDEIAAACDRLLMPDNRTTGEKIYFNLKP